MAMILTSDKQSRNTVIKPKRCNSSSIDDLPDELLVEIFQRVPYKAAFQCKCVSKRWLVFISDPYFTHSFISYHSNVNIKKFTQRELFFNFKFNEFLVASRIPKIGVPWCMSFVPCFRTSQLHDEACIVGSSNGLLLCCATTHYPSIYYVCDPRIEYSTLLPPTPTSPEKAVVGFINDCLDGEWCPSDFKVVRISTSHEERSLFTVETYTYMTNKWTISRVSCPQEAALDEFISNKPAIYCNRRLHWYCVIRQVILVYDLDDDEVTFIDCPKVDEDCPNVVPSEIRIHLKHGDILGVSRGSLRISQFHKFPSSGENSRLNIWKLKDYNTGKWCFEQHVDASLTSLARCLISGIL